MSFFTELRRRNVFRAGMAYLAVFWLILQVADVIVPLLQGPEWLLRALFFAALLGFPLTLILAWFYELTPEGVKTDAAADTGEGVRFTGRKVDFVIIGILVVAVGFLLVDDYILPEADRERSIAVLPFDNQGTAGADAAFFATGIHDDLITLLSKLGDIRVISRQSVERFRNTNQSIEKIAKTLGVTTVLEGGVRVAGGKVRINVQLTDADTENNLWAEVYDRELTATNIFGIQSEVALNIVNRLQATLSSDERQRLAAVPTRNLEAYEAYLVGRQELTRRTADSLQAAVQQFRRATEMDPDFALAYVGLADAYFVLQDWGFLSLDEVRPKIKKAVNRALKLNSQLGEAYVSLAAIYEMEHDYEAADGAYRRAIELNPGYATAHSWYGLFLRWRMGKIDQAVKQAELALNVDPLSAILRMAYGDVLSAAGQFDSALSQYQRSIELDPNFGGAKKLIGDHYLYAYGQTLRALEAYRGAADVDPNPAWTGDIGEVYLQLGDTATAQAWIEQARLTDADNFGVNQHLALLNYYRGADDLATGFALKSLEGPFYVRTPYLLSILRNADLRAGRYADALRRYEEFYPALAAEEPLVHLSNFRAAIDLSVVLEKLGETQRSEHLLEQSLAAVAGMPRLGLFGYGSADAEIYALQGKPAEAVVALRLAVDDGWWQHWFLWTELNPNLDSIRDEPEYGAIIAKLESNMASELARVRASEPKPSFAIP